MRILVAGATGAIGKPLIDYLIEYGHEVYGTTHSEERSKTLAAAGAKPLFLDVLNRDAVNSAMEKIRPDVVIDMLTSLPKTYTPESMRKASEMDSKIRLEGGGHFLSAAETYGVKRYIAQSAAFWYAPGPGLADESCFFAYNASPGIASGCHVYSEIERRVLQSNKIEGVAVRFGFFYGPGTWFHPDGDMGEQVRKQQFPIIGKGQGIWNFVHIQDAAKAAAAAVYAAPGAYNVVNARPAMMREWLPAFARYLGAPHPHHITEEEGLAQFGADSVYYATNLRGASYSKARSEFNFEPRSFEWML